MSKLFLFDIKRPKHAKTFGSSVLGGGSLVMVGYIYFDRKIPEHARKHGSLLFGGCSNKPPDGTSMWEDGLCGCGPISKDESRPPIDK